MPKRNKNKNKITKNIINNFILWSLIIIISITVLNYVDIRNKNENIPYSAVISLINNDNLNHNITKAVITGNELVATCNPECELEELEQPVASFNVILPNITIDKIDEWNNILTQNIKILKFILCRNH